MDSVMIIAGGTIAYLGTVFLNEARNFLLGCLICWLGITLLLAGITLHTENIIEEKLSAGVDLSHVSLKGQSNFKAQIQIIYKEGKRTEVLLVPGTTVPEK